MTEFHEEYQCVFGKQASLCAIMKHRISHMNAPIPKSMCEEEMQNANLDTNEVVIEYITDDQGNKIKKLKPLLIKSEPNREYSQNIPSDDNLPAVPKENFIQKSEVTIDSYSETVSSNDEYSDDRTITADSNTSATSSFEETPCKWECDTKGIEATLHQIASGLQRAVEGYLTLASHISKVAPYELPQVIAQIPKLCGLNYRKSTTLAETKSMLLLKEKEDPEVPNIDKEENKHLWQRQQHQQLILKL